MFGVGPREVAGADESFADEDDGQYDAHDAQRIGQGAAQRGAGGGDAHRLQGLLGGTEGRSIGRGAAEDTRHVGHGDAEGVAQGDGCARAEQDDGDGRNQ